LASLSPTTPTTALTRVESMTMSASLNSAADARAYGWYRLEISRKGSPNR
jgi:hypothetical protein